jgi:hypothetical protein
VEPGRKFSVQPRIVAEVAETQVSQMHKRTEWSRPVKAARLFPRLSARSIRSGVKTLSTRSLKRLLQTAGQLAWIYFLPARFSCWPRSNLPI